MVSPARNGAGRAGRIGFYHAAVADALAALQAPDPDLARERAETAAAQVDEARGAFAKALPGTAHLSALIGLLEVGL